MRKRAAHQYIKKKKGGERVPKTKNCNRDKGSVTHPKLDFLSYTKTTTGPDHTTCSDQLGGRS